MLSACTTITLEEHEAFDAKRTVSSELLTRLGCRREVATLEVEPGVELSTWHLTKPEARATILYFGGNGYLMEVAHDILLGVADGPYDVFTFDYRGYGESSGQPSVSALKSDALAVYDHVVTDIGVPPEQLVLHGHSLGSFVALYVANRRKVAGVIIETPITDVEALMSRLVPWWARWLVRFDIAEPLLEADNRAQVARLTRPLLIIAGESDPIAHPDMARELHERAGGRARLEILPGGGHNDLPPREDYRRRRAEFLREVR